MWRNKWVAKIVNKRKHPRRILLLDVLKRRNKSKYLNKTRKVFLLEIREIVSSTWFGMKFGVNCFHYGWKQWKIIHHCRPIIIFRLNNEHCQSTSKWNDKSEAAQNAKLRMYHFGTSSRKNILCNALTKLFAIFEFSIPLLQYKYVVAKQKNVSA